MIDLNELYTDFKELLNKVDAKSIDQWLESDKKRIYEG